MEAPSFKLSEFMKNPSLENAFNYLGGNENSATIVACAIAIFKGIFRPTFTMMDKKQDPEAKRYAAIREGLTELAALPIYAAVPITIGTLINKFYKGGSKKDVKVTSKFLGICAATLIIPAICNVVQPPVMKAYKKHEEAKKAKMGLDVNSVDDSSVNVQNPVNIAKPIAPVSTAFQGTFKNSKVNYGMKVGS